MNASLGPAQTTRGIWLTRSPVVRIEHAGKLFACPAMDSLRCLLQATGCTLTLSTLIILDPLSVFGCIAAMMTAYCAQCCIAKLDTFCSLQTCPKGDCRNPRVPSEPPEPVHEPGSTQLVRMQVTDIPTLVVDLEGCDGTERKDNPSFEKKIAAFALAVADVLIINIWAKDVGREDGACKPLLRTIFQVSLWAVGDTY